ncbi:MAG: hypothetical protein R3300_12345 [Candidatus Promineifilaceae bacterium]|nr:hypothetical protein [Candidatus Promineifilaceae bacterium]
MFERLTSIRPQMTVGVLLLVMMVGCGPSADPESAAGATASLTEAATVVGSATASATAVATAASTSSPPPPTATPPPSATADPPTPAPADDEPLFHSPEYGVQAFLWWRPDIALRDLGLVQELGFGWVKQSFAWRDIETLQKGSYDWYRSDLIVDEVEQAGLKLLVRLDRQPFWAQADPASPLENAPPADLSDFSDFCGVLAERYRGRIAAYQIWNEPNLSREWGGQPPDAGEYVALLSVCAEAIRTADPEAIIVSAGLAPTGTGLPVAVPDAVFLQEMYDAGAAAHFDALGVNAPGYKAPPEVSPDEAADTPAYGGGRWFAFRHVEDLRAIMEANGDADKQVVVLEMGWTTDQLNPDYTWHAVTETEQAEYLVRAYQWAAEHWRPWIGLMVTIYIADYDWTAETHEQWWWAITLPDGTRRPAFHALAEMEKVDDASPE